MTRDSRALQGSLLSLERKMDRRFADLMERLHSIETRLDMLLSHADFEKDFYEMEGAPPSYTVTLMGNVTTEEPEEES